MYTQCICRTLYMQVDPQLSTVLTKAKKANIMSSFKVNASLPESQGQDLGGQGQGLRGQGQGLDLRGQGQGRGLDFRGQGQGQANLASRRLEAKAVASRTTSLLIRRIVASAAVFAGRIKLGGVLLSQSIISLSAFIQSFKLTVAVTFH